MTPSALRFPILDRWKTISLVCYEFFAMQGTLFRRTDAAFRYLFLP